MRTEPWVINASMDTEHDGVFCFCPVKLRGITDGEIDSIVVGMNFISTEPPDDGYFYGVVHEDGQEAVERWCEEHADDIARLQRDCGRTPQPDGGNTYG